MNENDNMTSKNSSGTETSAEELLEKLPLLVNGQLDEQQSMELEAALKSNPELADEAAFLKSLSQGLKDQEEILPGPMGLARLKQDIEKEQEKEKKSTQHQSLSNHSHYWKPFALAACCVLAVQTAWHINEQPDTGDDSQFTPMSGQSINSQGPRLQLIFNDNATTQQIRTALFSIDGMIVNGPSALGIFTIELPKGSVTSDTMNTLKNFEFIEEVNEL